MHQADVSFYMVCRNFDREKFEENAWALKLQRAYSELTSCEDEAVLVAGLKEAIDQGTKAETSKLQTLSIFHYSFVLGLFWCSCALRVVSF